MQVLSSTSAVRKAVRSQGLLCLLLTCCSSPPAVVTNTLDRAASAAGDTTPAWRETQNLALQDLGNHLDKLFSFTKLDGNPALEGVISALETFVRYQSTSVRGTNTAIESGVETLHSNPAGERYRFTLTWTGMGSSSREMKVNILESPDGSRAAFNLAVTASTWRKQPNLETSGILVLGGELPEPQTLSEVRASLNLEPAGRREGAIRLALVASDFRPGDNLANLFSVFPYQEWYQEPFRMPLDTPLLTSPPSASGNRWAARTRPLSIRDVGPFSYPASVVLTGSIGAERVNLGASVETSNRSATLSGTLGPIDIVLKTVLQATSGADDPGLTGNRAVLRIRDRVAHLGLEADLDSRFLKKSGDEAFRHRFAWGPLNGTGYGLQAGETVLGDTRLFDDDGTDAFFRAEEPVGKRLGTIRPIVPQDGQTAAFPSMELRTVPGDVRIVNIRSILEKWIEVNSRAMILVPREVIPPVSQVSDSIGLRPPAQANPLVGVSPNDPGQTPAADSAESWSPSLPL